ncbi:MAG: TatD family hydrolase [Anaerolineae bacterium]
MSKLRGYDKLPTNSPAVRLLLRLVDTHAHLDFDAFAADRAEVLERAAAAGVEWILDVGADMASSRRAVALAGQQPGLWAAVGVHPHEAVTLSPEALDELRILSRDPRVLAIGEIGLDYYRDLAPRPVQREAFAAQLNLAQELQRPVIVHSREAARDTLEMLRAAGRASGGNLRGVMHCFSGDLALAKELVGLGLHIGIAGPVTYVKAQALREVARELPLDRLLLETDCPYLAPQVYRGKRNEPAYVRYVAEQVAELRGLSAEQVGCATSENAQSLFRPA